MTRSKFYTIHRDASETLAPISRGKWVKPKNKLVLQRGDSRTNNVIIRPTNGVIKNRLLPLKNATSASRSRWFRGY